MRVVRSLDQITDLKASVVTVGNFDGVHRGHAALFERVSREARSHNAAAVVLTFDPHTRSVVNPGTVQPILTTLEEKAVLIRPHGIDYLVCLPFNDSYARMDPEIFVEKILLDSLRSVGWVMGEGHSFGKNREGTPESLRRIVEKKHINVFVADSVIERTQTISSTSIRGYVSHGRMSEAIKGLGHPYLILARRIRGEGKGSQLGFPTLNFEQPPFPKVLPRAGIYAARLEYGTQTLAGALYFGSCPTFGNRECHFEFFSLSTPVIDPPVGETVRLWVLDFVRTDKKFTNEGDLISQMEQDVLTIRTILQGESQNATH